MSNCEFETPTDEEDNSDLDGISFIQMEWSDSTVWQTPSGPYWTNGEGEKPQGVPADGARVTIPTRMLIY